MGSNSPEMMYDQPKKTSMKKINGSNGQVRISQGNGGIMRNAKFAQDEPDNRSELSIVSHGNNSNLRNSGAIKNIPRVPDEYNMVNKSNGNFQRKPRPETAMAGPNWGGQSNAEKNPQRLQSAVGNGPQNSQKMLNNYNNGNGRSEMDKSAALLAKKQLQNQQAINAKFKGYVEPKKYKEQFINDDDNIRHPKYTKTINENLDTFKDRITHDYNCKEYYAGIHGDCVCAICTCNTCICYHLKKKVETQPADPKFSQNPHELDPLAVHMNKKHPVFNHPHHNFNTYGQPGDWKTMNQVSVLNLLKNRKILEHHLVLM